MAHRAQLSALLSAVLLLAFALVVATSTVAAAGLPNAFLGHWVGKAPTFTPAGPLLRSAGGVNVHQTD